MRESILRIVREFPGLHLRELARQADTSLNLVQYHVQRLHEGGYVDLSLEGGKVRVFPPDIRGKDRVLLACLRDRKRLRIAMVLLHGGPATHGTLAAEAKMGKSTLSFHLRSMEEAGCIITSDDGYALADRQAVRVLLDRYRPTPDAADRLAGLWGAIYGQGTD